MDLKQNIDAHAEVERRQLHSRLLATQNTQAYDNILRNFVWRDERQVPLKKLGYIFRDNTNCAYDQGVEYVIYRFTNNEGHEVEVSTKWQYKRGPSIFGFKPMIPIRNENGLS